MVIFVILTIVAGLFVAASFGLVLYLAIMAARNKRHQVFSHFGRVKEAK